LARQSDRLPERENVIRNQHTGNRRGKKRVGLGVDAGSLTGATRLYEKASMRTVQQMAAYELELCPGKELGTQSAES